MKSKTIKIALTLSLILVQFFGFTFFAIGASTNCTADISFNPSYSGGAVMLSGTVTWTNSQSACVDNNGKPVTQFTISYYINGIEVASNNPPTGIQADSYGHKTALGPQTTQVNIQQDSSSALPFNTQFDPFAKNLGGQNIQIQACAWPNDNVDYNNGLLRCSANTSVVIPKSASQTAPAATPSSPSNPAATPTNDQYKNCLLNGGDTTICAASYPDTSSSQTSPNTPAGSAMSQNSPTTLFNPLPEQDLVHVFLLVAQGFLGILGILSVVFIIVGGFQMVIAAGNEETYLKAKKTIIWAILGLAVAVLSFSIVAIVEDLLQVNIPSATSTPTTPPASTQTTP